MLPIIPLAAESESDSAKERRETAELKDAQADMAKAYGDYYQALRTSPKTVDLAALQQQTLGPAEGKMVALLSKRHEESQKMIYNKVYFADGTIMDVKDFNKLPANRGLAAADTSDPDTKRVKSVQNGSGVPGNGTQGAATFRGTGGGSGEAPQGWVLDGTNVPKELSFPGKQKPKK